MKISGMRVGARGGANRAVSALAAIGIMLGAAVPAQAGAGSDSEKLMRLNIMLMVTGLRCRSGSDDFWSDYGRFSTKHMGLLKGANADMRSNFARRYGAKGSKRALDRLSVTMANAYGQGHPWLDCGQLKMVASNLAQVDGRATLVEAANQLLSVRPIEQLALADR